MTDHLSPQQLIHAAETFGTPLYVYNADVIKQQYQQLTKAFGTEKVRFFYACKALTNINILKLIKNMGCSVDCSSINEVHLALHAGFSAQEVLYTSNGVSFEEIEEARRLGVHINIDSLSNLEKFAKKFGAGAPVGIRLRPGIMAGGNIKISTGHDKSKFGIPVHQLEDILNIMRRYDVRITNLHIHTGSDIKDAGVFLKGVQVLIDLVPDFPHLAAIDLGGGFKVRYHHNDEVLNIDELAEKVLAAFGASEATKNLQIWFEPGKFLVSACGYFITRVNVIKNTPVTTFVSVNSGFNHLIRPMFYDAYHYVENISNPQGAKAEYTVVGNICETDTFAWDRQISEIREGDFLVFHNAGAYGFEMSSNYNARLKPAEVLFENGSMRLIRKRDSFEDLLRGQVTE